MTKLAMPRLGPRRLSLEEFRRLPKAALIGEESLERYHGWYIDFLDWMDTEEKKVVCEDLVLDYCGAEEGRSRQQHDVFEIFGNEGGFPGGEWVDMDGYAFVKRFLKNESKGLRFCVKKHIFEKNMRICVKFF